MGKTNRLPALDDKKLLSFWRKACLERAGYRCEYPECRINAHQLHAHHIYSRRNVSTRYLLDNSLCLCSVHHTMGAYSAHNDPDFKDIIMGSGVRSEGFFDDLRIIRNQVQKNNIEFRWDCYNKLKPYL